VILSLTHDPTLRLDSGTLIELVTRRSVTAAIHQSQLWLNLYPLPPLRTFSRLCYSTAQNSRALGSCCALREPVLQSSLHHPHTRYSSDFNGTPYAPRFLFKTITGYTDKTACWVCDNSPTTFHRHNCLPSPAVHRRAQDASLPAHSALPSPPSSLVLYLHPGRLVFNRQPSRHRVPSCTTGWCLARLRTTCELWRFVRTGSGQGLGGGNARCHAATSTRAEWHAQWETAKSTPQGLPSSMNVGVREVAWMASSALGRDRDRDVTPTKQNGAACGHQRMRTSSIHRASAKETDVPAMNSEEED